MNNSPIDEALGASFRQSSTRRIKAKAELQLYRLPDFTKVEKEKGHLKRNMCTTDGSYLLDTGSNLYLWVGKGCPKTQKKESLKLAQDFIANNNRPAWTQVTSIIEMGEPAEFKAYFFQWNPPRLPGDFKRDSKIAKTPEQKEIDVANQAHGDVEAVIYRGWLEKRVVYGFPWQRRWYVLHADSLASASDALSTPCCAWPLGAVRLALRPS